MRIVQLPFSAISRAIALGLVSVLLLWGLGIGPVSPAALASPLPSVADDYRVEQPGESVNLEQGANKAEEASEAVDEGLTETQQRFGAAESTNELIEQARETAKSKLKSLSARAKESQNSETSSITQNDQRTLKRLQNEE